MPANSRRVSAPPGRLDREGASIIKRRRLCLLVLVVLPVALVAAAPRARGQSLRVVHSHHYAIHTNMTLREVEPFAVHMDLVFNQYRQRFASFQSHNVGPMPFYLLRTREQYLQFMSRHGINAANSGGMFFVARGIRGLATWASGRARSRTFAVLQHEGFHQFAYNYIGRKLPPWANEGIAQYFQDAIIIGKRMRMGLANAERLDLVQTAIRRGHFVSVDKLVNISNARWEHILQTDAQSSSLLYAEAWDLVYFFVHADDGRYRKAFERYLHLVANGMSSRGAFGQAFGTEDFDIVQQNWLRFAVAQQPAALNIAVSRMQFLGAALKYLARNDDPMPGNMNSLRRTLRLRGFRIIRRFEGLTRTISAQDSRLYQYRRNNGVVGTFELLDPERRGLPPGITAPGLSPQPTLVWTYDDRGRIEQDIQFH